MAQPVWVTPAGSLGTIPEGVFYSTPLEAIEPDTFDTVYYQLIAGELPAGIQINDVGLMSGIPKAVTTVQGVPAQVSRDVVSKFAVRAFTQRVVNGITIINRLADRTFTLTVTGQDAPEFITPPGQIAEYYDGSVVSGLQIEYLDIDPSDIVVVKLVAGSLPPGLTLSPSGLISGFIPVSTPIDQTAGYSRDGQGYDAYPYAFGTRAASYNYQFILEVTDGVSSSQRSFSIFVWALETMTADNTVITADNTFITADVSPVRPPIILTPEGSIGSTRNDNFYAFQFEAVDLNGDSFTFSIADGYSLPPGLALNVETGYLYGYIPDLGITEQVYNFAIMVEQADDPAIFSGPYYYSLTITGPISSEIVWLTDSDLGTIINGSTSIFYVSAVNKGGLELQYKLDGVVYPVVFDNDFDYPTPVYNQLPQGLELLSDGNISGRVSFNTFALDLGATTFDITKDNGNDPTTFDMTFSFTVTAYSSNGIATANKRFTITVIRRYNEPYENLYIQAMPPQNDRELINSLIQNSDIFAPDLIYRPSDPNFGVSTGVVYHHAYGLTAATIEDYYSALYENHYWKDLVLGSIETAQATDSNGNVIYEVVYSKILGGLTNNAGESVAKQVTLPYTINYNDQEINTVYPASLPNMRDQVIDVVGQISNLLPLWMLSPQQDGRVLGFTPAWVIAYTKPNKAEQIAYYIRTQFGNQLNLVDFKVDRYELDRLLSKNWDPIYDSTQGSWIPNPPSYTTFDAKTSSVTLWTNNSGQIVLWENDDLEIVNWSTGDFTPGQATIFDGGSLKFIAPVDMYSNTQEYDKYLVFPKRTILG